MEEDWREICEMKAEIVAALIVLHVICWAYAFVCEFARYRWPASKRYTFAWVVGGVMMTMLAASFAIGLENAVWMVAFFMASGIPMAVGAMVKHVWLDSREVDEAAAREHLRRGLEEG